MPTPLAQFFLALALATLVTIGFHRSDAESVRAAEMACARGQAAAWLAAQPIREAPR
jgi:hypothetical protein